MCGDEFLAASVLQEFRAAFAQPSGVDSKVQIVCADTHDYIAMALAEALIPMLDGSQRERINSYRCMRSRAESVLGIALARFGISSLSGVPMAAVRFARAEGGKPIAAGPHPAQKVHFSVTHSAGRVLCGFSVGGELGVDLETAVRSNELDVAMRYFSRSERDQLARQPEAAQQYYALRQWTLKEAYLKAIGTGLVRELASFSIHSRNGIYTIEDPVRPGDTRRWAILNRVESSGETWSVVWAHEGVGAIRRWRLAGSHLLDEGGA